MQTDIQILDNGLLNSNQLLFPLSLLVPRSPSPLKKATLKDPSIENPHRKKALLPEIPEDPRGILKKNYQLPPPHRQPPRQENDDDEDEEAEENNKENQPPENQEPRGPGGPLHQLLTKWGRDIDQFRRTIWDDLEDFKRTLGIHLFSV
ncbi:hypothetical protein [Human papillomavirus 135]|uniref:E4 protein n=1 Tax=Human papillomavirus 135 TaxID=1070408 RepID=I3P6K7_9PAPI|nr:hypothetical protein [Human papillomavirus 135]AEM24597.1 hypothetical protein [Human papillomavirus 135]